MNHVDLDVVFERIQLSHKHAGADTEIRLLPWSGYFFEVERILNGDTTLLGVMIQEHHVCWVWGDMFSNVITKGICQVDSNIESVVVEICVNFACGHSHTTHTSEDAVKK